MTSPAELSFPVLALTHQGFLYAVSEEAALRTARVRAVKLGHFDNLRVIDAGGASYRVTRAHDLRVAPGEWLGRLFGSRANPRMRAQLELEKERVLTLDEAKREVRGGIRKLAHIHAEAIGGTGYILSQVDRAATIPELIACFFGFV